MGNFELDPSYKDVPGRIADFKAKHPEGRLRPVNEKEPYRIECIRDQYFIVYVAAAYLGPDDKLPGIGSAWEPFPGKTPYTKDSELQNAETSAWGRAIVAALASESKSVASAEDVRNRRADADVKPIERHTTPEGELIEVWPGEVWVNDAKARLVEVCSGDKDRAVATWTEAKLDGKWKVTDVQLAEVLGLAEALDSATEQGEGVEPSSGSSTPDPDQPGALTAFNDEVAHIAASAEVPA